MNTFYCIGVSVNFCPCYKQIYNDNCCPVSKHLKLLSDTNILSLCLKCLYFLEFYTLTYRLLWWPQPYSDTKRGF